MKTFRYCIAIAALSIGIGVVTDSGDAHHQSDAELEFVNNSTCKLCHNDPAKGEQFAKWKATDHARAYTTLMSEESDRIAREMGLTTKAVESPECLRCHVTGYDPQLQQAPSPIVMREGVQCDSCHGKGSAHLADGKQLRMDPDADVDLKAHRTAPHEAICLQCHNTDSPTWDPQRYTLESGETAGFDFIQARRKIVHPTPERAHLFFGDDE